MSELELVLMAALGAATVGMAIVAVAMKNLVRSVVAYALASAFLAALFFVLASPFAGALELTVGAGLGAMLVLVALLLAGGDDRRALPRTLRTPYGPRSPAASTE